MNHRGRWRIGALASAIALLGSLASLEAHALALGRITVQSALGEPLRAEIDIADITADEASSLKAGVASADTFKAAGLEYTTALSGLQINLQRRADGRAYLRLTSSRPVNEPFVDLILEASWASGRITRDYTMLFDPPNLRSAGTAVTPTAPQLSRPVAPSTAAPARGTTSPPATPPAPPAAKAAPADKAPVGDKQLTVKAGDTAGKIAAENKPASVSLDQMLVAMLRSNPNAFIGGNINRLKSGAVLEMPSAETASAISPREATQTIVAQSRDFNSFRRKLAEGVPTAQVADADRQAGGKVQAKVEDRTPATTTPDKLTLSKGAVQGKAATEDKIAKDRQAQDASTRVAELSKNISDLNKLGVTPAPVAAASAAKAPGVALPAPSGLAAPAPAPVPPAAVAANSAQPGTAGSPVSTPAAPASAATAVPAVPAASAAAAANAADSTTNTAAAAITPASAAGAMPPVAAVVPPKKPVVVAPPPPEPSLVDGLLENPLTLPLAGGLLALLAGFGFYRYRQRGNPAQVDSSFLESRLQPDSFFGASGGQRIDTNEGNATGSSLVYSPSQLDAAGDVDPVAEADVYLAYGRDLQAEEILKEALRTSPTRVAIHAKLMEIYAKRRDTKAFETVAVEAFNLTQGNGPDWAYISEMGRELDPGNPMYQPGGQPMAGGKGSGAAAFNTASGTVARAAQPAPAAPVTPPVVDVDLDLDFSLGDAEDAATTPVASPTPPVRPTPPRPPEPPVAAKPAPAPAPALPDLDMDFGSATVSLPEIAAPAPVSKPAAAPALEMDFPSAGLDFTPEPIAAPKPVLATKAAAAPAPAASDSGMLEFDLGSLSLDLDDGPATESPIHTQAAASNDPLETKFQLAEEFRSLGDPDGARSLAEEVLAEAKGPLKVKAQAFLNALA